MTQPAPLIFINKVALVTGSSRGIGRAIALELARNGADIIIHYARKRTAAEAVAQEVTALGRKALVVRANLAQPETIDAMFDKIEAEFGQCDILVGNAASGVHAPLMDTTDKHWDWTMDINARSILRCAKRAAPLMEAAGWGRIVTITSLGSVRYVPSYGMVGISKAAIESLTRYLAAELAPKGIVVNAISPGLVDTDALASLPIDTKRTFAYVREYNPARALVTADDIAKTVRFLCSDDARMMIGQTLIVDGGYSLLADYFRK